MQGERVPVAGGRGRPPKDAAAKPATRVVHRTLANLSKLPAELVGLVEAWCKNGGAGAGSATASPGSGVGSPPLVRLGPFYEVLAALHALAAEVGLVAALGPGEARVSGAFKGPRVALTLRWAFFAGTALGYIFMRRKLLGHLAGFTSPASNPPPPVVERCGVSSASTWCLHRPAAQD